MLVLATADRLKVQVPALGERVSGAIELAALVAEDALPQVMPAAFVLPLGLQGGEAKYATGAFLQMFDETVGVLLVVQAAGDVTGAIALPDLDALIESVITKIAGWAPDNVAGCFELRRGALVSLTAGAALYQLDFAIVNQLRVMS